MASLWITATTMAFGTELMERVMRTMIITAVILMMTISAQAGNPNLGKADGYGSDRYAAVNTCMAESINNKQRKPDPHGLTLVPCMGRFGFEFCSNCQIWGNRG